MRRVGAGLGVLLVALVGGCASEPDAEEPAAFCVGATALADGTALHGLDLTDLEDLAVDDPDLAAATDAVAGLVTLDAPSDIAEQWRAVVDPLAAFLDALRTADRSSATYPDALRAPTDALVTHEVVDAGEAVDAYVAERC